MLLPKMKAWRAVLSKLVRWVCPIFAWGPRIQHRNSLNQPTVTDSHGKLEMLLKIGSIGVECFQIDQNIEHVESQMHIFFSPFVLLQISLKLSSFLGKYWNLCLEIFPRKRDKLSDMAMLFLLQFSDMGNNHSYLFCREPQAIDSSIGFSL